MSTFSIDFFLSIKREYTVPTSLYMQMRTTLLLLLQEFFNQSSNALRDMAFWILSSSSFLEPYFLQSSFVWTFFTSSACCLYLANADLATHSKAAVILTPVNSPINNITNKIDMAFWILSSSSFWNPIFFHLYLFELSSPILQIKSISRVASFLSAAKTPLVAFTWCLT